MLLAGFDDLDWAAIHKDLSVEVEGIPSPVALSNPFYTVGTPPRPGFGHHPTPLNAVELEAAFREPHANWVSYMWRGDLAFECNEPYPFDDHRRLSA
jgi:hypothetical protein